MIISYRIIIIVTYSRISRSNGKRDRERKWERTIYLFKFLSFFIDTNYFLFCTVATHSHMSPILPLLSFPFISDKNLILCKKRIIKMLMVKRRSCGKTSGRERKSQLRNSLIPMNRIEWMNEWGHEVEVNDASVLE